MEIDNEELQKDLQEQYAILEEEVQEDKKKKRYLLLFVFFLVMFLFMFGTTFSYFKLYNNQPITEKVIIKDLYIEGYEDVFKWDENVKTYVLNVASDTKQLNIKYTLGCQNCSVKIIGNENLKPGNNQIEIIAIDENNNETKYIIYVIVDENSDLLPGEEISNDLSLKDLEVTNHSLDSIFNKDKTSYIVNDINKLEDKIEVLFKLADNSNKVSFKLNGNVVTRKPLFIEDEYKLKLDVKTELVTGANKLEIIIKDENGNEKIYNLFLVVSEYVDDEKVIEILVENGTGNQAYIFENIIPGWESLEKQSIRITNTSNYDINVDLTWTEVINTFVNTNDLSYTLYLNDNIIKTGILPTSDEILIKNLKISANSSNNYLIGYKYSYSDEDQNIDQGKTFSTKVGVTISE